MERLFARLESMKDETISTLGELVRIKTQVPPGENYAEAVDYMALHLKPEFISYSANRHLLPHFM